MRNIIAVTSVVLLAAASQASGAEQGARFFSGHALPPDTPRYEGVAACIQSIQAHWPKEAGLVLKKTARIWGSEDARFMAVDGSVWDNGKRRRVTHECILEQGSPQLASREDVSRSSRGLATQ